MALRISLLWSSLVERWWVCSEQTNETFPGADNSYSFRRFCDRRKLQYITCSLQSAFRMQQAELCVDFVPNYPVSRSQQTSNAELRSVEKRKLCKGVSTSESPAISATLVTRVVLAGSRFSARSQKLQAQQKDTWIRFMFVLRLYSMHNGPS